MDTYRDNVHKIAKLLLESEYFMECDVSQCQYTSRHHRDRSIITADETLNDVKLEFYKEILDSLHFFIFHIYITLGL